jgi:hypothetical protein
VLISSLIGAAVAFILDKYIMVVTGLIAGGLGAGLCTFMALWFANRTWSLGLTQDLVLLFPRAARIFRAFEAF